MVSMSFRERAYHDFLSAHKAATVLNGAVLDAITGFAAGATAFAIEQNSEMAKLKALLRIEA